MSHHLPVHEKLFPNHFYFSPNIVYCPNILGCVSFYWSMVNLPEATFLEITDSASSRSDLLPIVSQLGGRTSYPTSFPLLALAWLGLCMLSESLGSYIELPCCVQQTASLWSFTVSVSYTLLGICTADVGLVKEEFIVSFKKPVLPQSKELSIACPLVLYIWADSWLLK